MEDKKKINQQKALCCGHSPQRSSHQINHNLRNKIIKTKASSSVHTVCDLWLKTHTALFLPHQKQQHKELKKASKYTKLCTRTMKFSPCSTVQTWVEMPWQNELQFLFALWHVETPCWNWPHSLFALWQVETPQQNKPQSLFRNRKPSLHYKWWRHSKTNHNPSFHCDKY